MTATSTTPPPAPLSAGEWQTILRREVNPSEVTLANFVMVMEKWRDHPENIWRGVESVSVSANQTPSPGSFSRLMTLTSHVCQRHGADLPGPHLFRDRVVFSAADQSRVEFEPEIPSEDLSQQRSAIPKFYPKATRFAFVLEAKGALRMDVVPLSDEVLGEHREKLQFAAEKLLTKLESWARAGTSYRKLSSPDSLFPREAYTEVYRGLKQKYLKEWSERWKGRTNTAKYVSEDLAIAAYVICLCEEERRTTPGLTKEQQSFADLGCGNGFLVYLLASEGFPGMGIDLNERKVWGMYDRSIVKLHAQPFDPTTASLPGTRWIIGNHADELTPWIPVIAARSDHASYLSIPCCFWDFDSKFQHVDQNIGKYRTYVRWLKDKVAKTCGYDAEQDTMRIPSIKNIALVGRRKCFDGTQEGRQVVLSAVLDMLAKYKKFRIREVKTLSQNHGGSVQKASTEGDQKETEEGDAAAGAEDNAAEFGQQPATKVPRNE